MLKEKKSDLESRGMMKAAFAHEIKNHLTSLKTFAQMIPEKYDDPDFRNNFFTVVQDDIRKIDTLIENLFDFPGNDNSTGTGDYDLIMLLNEILDDLQKRLELEDKDIKIARNFNSKEFRMTGNVSMLRQSFGNIINNGCQAIERSGTLMIDINRNGKNTDVMISDNGEGIPQDRISRIFDPFHTTKSSGFGLGLAISKRIIEDHGGHISVQSALYKGTTFIISLPSGNSPDIEKG